jgi:hypothetical protein
VGGPGNSLDRNYHYLIDKDLRFNAEKTDNTDVVFVSPFRRHDNLWINRRVRSINLGLDWVLLEHDVSSIGVIDTASIMREDYTSNGLHLNSQGMRRLVNLTAERMGDNQVTSVSSVPVITHTRASPFLT